MYLGRGQGDAWNDPERFLLNKYKCNYGDSWIDISTLVMPAHLDHRWYIATMETTSTTFILASSWKTRSCMKPSLYDHLGS